MNVERHKLECLERFLSAVREGRRQSFTEAQTIAEHIRRKHGDGAAMIAKRELFAYIKSDSNANETRKQKREAIAQPVDKERAVKRNGKTVRV